MSPLATFVASALTCAISRLRKAQSAELPSDTANCWKHEVRRTSVWKQEVTRASLSWARSPPSCRSLMMTSDPLRPINISGKVVRTSHLRWWRTMPKVKMK